MNTIVQFLKGKKTYLLGGVAILYAVTGYYSHNLDAKAALDAVWAALTVMGLRAGIQNTIQSLYVQPSTPQS